MRLRNLALALALGCCLTTLGEAKKHSPYPKPRKMKVPNNGRNSNMRKVKPPKAHPPKPVKHR